MVATTQRYRRRRALHIANGTWNPWGDLAAVRAHITYLLDNQWSSRSIADAAGVSDGTIRRLRTTATGVTTPTADAILAIQARQRPHHLPAIGYTRRLQALAHQGHGLPAVAHLTGLDVAHLRTIRSGNAHVVYARTARRIDAAYTRLRHQDPPPGRGTSKVRTVAHRNGWHGHQAWTRHTIDDPGARPLNTAHAA